MKKATLITFLAVTAIFLSFKAPAPSTWTLDKNHAKLGFTITHIMVSEIEGSFKSFDAKITSPGEDFTDAVVEMTADAASINTDNDARDKHLKTPDFFDAAVFTTVTFKSTSFKKTSDKTYKVKGNLTMHGVTKPVELDATCNIGTDQRSKKPIAGFKLTGTINRTDFGIGTKFPSAMLSNEVSIIARGEFHQE